VVPTAFAQFNSWMVLFKLQAESGPLIHGHTMFTFPVVWACAAARRRDQALLRIEAEGRSWFFSLPLASRCG
jgi:hypothetical protein